MIIGWSKKGSHTEFVSRKREFEASTSLKSVYLVALMISHTSLAFRMPISPLKGLTDFLLHFRMIPNNPTIT